MSLTTITSPPDARKIPASMGTEALPYVTTPCKNLCLRSLSYMREVIWGTTVAREKRVEKGTNKQEVQISQVSMKFTFIIEKYEHHLPDSISLSPICH